MGGASKNPSGLQTPLVSDELRLAWNHFRSGDMVACPVDRAPLALTVDASAGIYRFVCTECGVVSAWFESGTLDIRLCGHLAGHRPHED
jgi:uncharacterized protein YbaR (Trm112 family)